MTALVIGATSYFGVFLTEKLIGMGHDVTLATRGIKKDHFGQKVKRMTLDRTDSESVKSALGGCSFDVIFDNYCMSSNDVKALLDVVNTKRYIFTSSRGVYHGIIDEGSTDENGFDPLSYKLKWCSFDDDTSYYEAKRQAESAIFQVYGGTPSVAVRFPIVIGENDPYDRMAFYVNSIINMQPMNIINPNALLSCIKDEEAGSFLAWLADGSITGPINASGIGGFTVSGVISYIEKKTGKAAILDKDGLAGTCNRTTSLVLNTSKAVNAGYRFSAVEAWICDLLDRLIEKAR